MSKGHRFRVRIINKDGTWETIGKYFSLYAAERAQKMKAFERKNSLVVLQTAEGIRISAYFYY